MSQLNEVIKNFLFAASLKPDDTLISKVVSAKRLLYINLGAEVDRYPYSTAVATEITCKEMLIAVDRPRLIQASASSMSANGGGNKASTTTAASATSKKYNPKDYVQRLYTFRNVLKKTMTTDKLFTLLHHSHHVLPAALVENTQQSLSTLFEALDRKDPCVANANANETVRTASSLRRRTEDEETVLTSISRAEYFCAGIFCEAKRRPELGALLKLEQLTELAEVQADAFRNAAKILLPLLQTYVYAETAKATVPPPLPSASSSSSAPSSSTKRRTVAPEEVLDFDDDNDSYGILAVAVDSVDGGDSETAATGGGSRSSSSNNNNPFPSAPTMAASSTLGKRNLQAFLQSDRRRHLADLAYQQQQQKEAASAAVRAHALKGEDDEETKRQRQLQETQRWRLLYEIWRESVTSSSSASASASAVVV
jgi:hypothetical protein